MDFHAVGAPQGAGYGSGLMNFGMLSGQPQQNQQQPQPGNQQPGQSNQQQQNPAYSLGQGIGQWLKQYFAQQQQGQGQPGDPTSLQPPPVVGPGGPQGLY